MYVFVWRRGGGGGSTQTNIVFLKQNAGNWRRPLTKQLFFSSFCLCSDDFQSGKGHAKSVKRMVSGLCVCVWVWVCGCGWVGMCFFFFFFFQKMWHFSISECAHHIFFQFFFCVCASKRKLSGEKLKKDGVRGRKPGIAKVLKDAHGSGYVMVLGIENLWACVLFGNSCMCTYLRMNMCQKFIIFFVQAYCFVCKHVLLLVMMLLRFFSGFISKVIDCSFFRCAERFHPEVVQRSRVSQNWSCWQRLQHRKVSPALRWAQRDKRQLALCPRQRRWMPIANL